MASRVKKIFHRKRDEDAEQPRYRTHDTIAARDDPALRTSLYESTTAAGLPQTGDYPLKGNDSSIMLQHGRKSSVRSRGSSAGHQNAPYRSPTPEQYNATRNTPPISLATNAGGPASYDSSQQHPPLPLDGTDDRRKRWSQLPLPQDSLVQDISGLHIRDPEGQPFMLRKAWEMKIDLPDSSNHYNQNSDYNANASSGIQCEQKRSSISRLCDSDQFCASPAFTDLQITRSN